MISKLKRKDRKRWNRVYQKYIKPVIPPEAAKDRRRKSMLAFFDDIQN